MTPARWAHRTSSGRWVCPPHLALLNLKLTQVAAGTISRLLICMPPRHGKSEFASKYFPAWYLGTFPDRRIILASYESDFAAQWGRKVRDLLTEYGEAFFGVGVRTDSSAADRWDLEGHEGGMSTAGVGGPLTGKGAHLLIIDDPVKNAEEAVSPTMQAKAWDWYVSTAYTRLEPGAAVILIQTRWHAEDLAGKVLASAKRTGEAWDVLNLPALAEDDDPLGRKPGEALWPARYSAGRLLEIKRTQDDPAAALVRHWFDALYQQRPVPAEGGIFKKAWLRYWEPASKGEYYRLTGGELTRTVKARDCRRFGVMDLAFSLKSSADYTVILAWAVTPDADLILLDCFRDRIDGPALVPQLEKMMLRHGLDYVGVEDVQGQTLMIQEARRKGLTVRSLHPDKDKVTRAIPASIRMEAGQVYLPRSAPWLAELETELLTFPNGSHDDMVDCLAYACLEVSRRGGSETESREMKIARERLEAEAEAVAAREHRRIDNPIWWT